VNLSSKVVWFMNHIDDLPLAMHRAKEMDDGGNPAWTKEFSGFIDHAAFATVAERDESYVHEGTQAEQATKQTTISTRYRYPMRAAIQRLQRCRARAGDPRPVEIARALLATRGNIYLAQDAIGSRYPLMSHREPWLEALDRTLTLIMERYQEAPTAMIGAVKSDAQLDAEATDSV
jgi:hypothetical protein